ncbi:unnamed protein product, partial [Prunus brigantina]
FFTSIDCPPLHLDTCHPIKSFFNVRLIIDFLKVLGVSVSLIWLLTILTNYHLNQLNVYLLDMMITTKVLVV